MKSRTLSAVQNPERHEYFCKPVTPNSDVEFGKNLVRLSRQSATGANRRFQLQKKRVDTQPKFQPAYNGTLILRVAKATVLANSKQRGRSRDTNRSAKSEIRIRHQTSDIRLLRFQ